MFSSSLEKSDSSIALGDRGARGKGWPLLAGLLSISAHLCENTLEPDDWNAEQWRTHQHLNFRCSSVLVMC